jgi:hypothetical protein
MPGTIEDQELVPGEYGLGDHGAEAARSQESDKSSDAMDEKDDENAHLFILTNPGIVWGCATNQQFATGRRTSFALRQTWSGARYEATPSAWLKAGTEYRWAWLEALPGTNPAFSTPEAYFPNLPGYRTQTRLRSVGAYVSLNGIPGEYRLGGALHLGASYQEGLGRNRLLKYYTYEIQMEGRLPMASGRSAFVGQANLEFNRKSSGGDPIPFYLLPHIGGWSTLRGFRLDTSWPAAGGKSRT